MDTTGYDGNPYLSIDKCVDFERYLLLELWKLMWRNHHSVYQYHMKYVCNDIVKPFKAKIIRYSQRLRETTFLSASEWQVTIAEKQLKVDIDNNRENARQVIYD